MHVYSAERYFRVVNTWPWLHPTLPDRGDRSRHLRKLSGRSTRHDFTPVGEVLYRGHADLEDMLHLTGPAIPIPTRSRYFLGYHFQYQTIRRLPRTRLLLLVLEAHITSMSFLLFASVARAR